MATESITGAIPDGWQATTLGAICSHEGGSIQTGPFGSQLHAADYVPVGIPSIMPVNIGDNRIIPDGIARITEADAERLGKHRVRPGDIVYSRRGDVERRALVRQREAGWLCGTGCLKVRFGGDAVNPLYASYYLGHPEVRNWIVRHAVGATMPNLNTAIMEAIPFLLPPRKNQDRIAEILGTFDDKIELNRRMNETLEAIARALFKSWFIDFDPVHAKAAGKQPEGLDPATAALFPDAFQNSPLGKIPKGWRAGTLGDNVGRVAMGPFGSNIKTDNFVPEGIPVVRGSNLTNGFVDEGFVFLRESKADELHNANAFPGDLVVTHRGTLGQVGLIPPGARYSRYVVSQSQMLIRPDPKNLPSHFLYLFLTSPSGRHALLANTSQTGVPAIAQPTSSVKAIPLICPSGEVIAQFEAAATAVFALLSQRQRESRALAATRDALLPRLLSGEVKA